MAACLVVVAVVVGAMVLLRVRTTVITSNITSLLLILSMAHSVHLIVHYKEVLATRPFLCRLDAVKKAVRQMAVPCFYISATTAVGFLSLLISGIRPVMQFGWFMAFGIALAFAVTFVLVPAGLLLFPNGPSFYRAVKVVSPFRRIASLPVNRPRTVVLAAVCVGILSVVGIMGLPALGIPGLGVETIFVDYFHKDTDIYKGLIFVDQEMGGTSSLEVILVEAFFQDLPHVGKVISARSMTSELQKILAANGQKPPSEAGFPPRFLLRVLASLSGRGGERAALWSYISHDFSTARVFVRLREADPDLDRNALVARVRAFTEGNPDLDGLKVDVTGVFVLYANMLNSLIDGQIKTFGLVFVAIAAMFLALFRSLRIALLAMIPNILPVLAVLGFMGLADVPLDMNNIMIASVALGIAVDDTIHYIFRFRVEFARDGDYAAAVYRTHESIGRAILLTSVIITAGFSLLVASNFKPTVYFGFFTAFSMTAALFCAITLLPALLVLFRPLGSAKE
jgi:predicted RND superfamily exporter protein